MSDEVVEGWKWMPLSQRLSDSPTYHDVLEPIPGGPLATALDEWVSEAIRLNSHSENRVQRINIIAGREVVGRIPGGGFGRLSNDLLEVVDLALHLLYEHVIDVDVRPNRFQGDTGSEAALLKLQKMLKEGRSLWAVGRLPDQSFGLVQRVDEASRVRANTVLAPDTIAAGHLRRAWGELYQRESKPKASMDESVLALESAMRSVVSPKNQRATLGTVIRDLRAKPDKWAVPIGTVSQLADRLDCIWKNQPRHGVDDHNDLVEVSRSLADAALHEAIAIVHWCVDGLFRRTDDLQTDQPTPDE